MTATATAEPVETEELSEEEAYRQMEAAFQAGPAGQLEQASSLTVTEEGDESGDTAKSDDTPQDSGAQSGAEVVDTKTEETPAKDEAKSEGLTDDKVLELLKTSQTTEELRAGIKKLRDETFGRVGGLERTLKALQEGLAAPGQETDIEEHFAELKEQYPDAAPLIIKGIKQAMKQAKSVAITTGEAPNPEELVQKILPQIEETVSQRFDMRFIQRTLDREHKGWREIVGEPNSNTEFRTWLKGKPNEQEILGSYDVDLLSDILTEFKEHKKTKTEQPKPPASSTRTNRLEEAVTTKGKIKPPAPRPKSDEEEFEAGFREGPAGRR